MSRQSSQDNPTTGSSFVEVESPSQEDASEQPNSANPYYRRMSKDSEGYPSWLPKRPPPPAPASTYQSSLAHEAGPSEQPQLVGRKPTPRSVRIFSLQDSLAEKNRREPTDQTRVNQPRVWSRAMGTPTALNEDLYTSRIPQPKFRTTGLHMELLRNPTFQSYLRFYLYPLFVFAHIPIQTFFDFNAVFMLIE